MNGHEVRRVMSTGAAGAPTTGFRPQSRGGQRVTDERLAGSTATGHVVRPVARHYDPGDAQKPKTAMTISSPITPAAFAAVVGKCPVCGKSGFKTPGALGGHVRFAHKEKVSGNAG